MLSCCCVCPCSCWVMQHCPDMNSPATGRPGACVRSLHLLQAQGAGQLPAAQRQHQPRKGSCAVVLCVSGTASCSWHHTEGVSRPVKVVLARMRAIIVQRIHCSAHSVTSAWLGRCQGRAGDAQQSVSGATAHGRNTDGYGAHPSAS